MAVLALPLAPTQSAQLAGLRYVDPDSVAGLRRIRRGRKSFFYVDARARPVRNAATLERIRKLAIPPAWEDVWISPTADAHIQAVGRDARGRKQYRYHPGWREVRDATKYNKLIAFLDALPRIRAACDRDLRLRGLPRRKVLAAAVRILEQTHIRVGNEEYARQNRSYGLTTLRDRHVTVDGAELHFRFRGKAGKVREVGLRDQRLARVVRACSELPGHELFQYVDDDGELRAIDSGDVNEYIRATAGDEFTAKDFRTWAGTLLALRALREAAPCTQRTRANKQVIACIRTVACALGNTPSVCKRCYVHPAVLDAYLEGTLAEVRGRAEESILRTVLVRAARTSNTQGLEASLRASLRAARAIRKQRQ